MKILGIDIGGTNCAVSIGNYEQNNINIVSNERISTDLTVSPDIMLQRICTLADCLLNGFKPDRIGISCGGPLNISTGRIKGPPNLTGWTDVPIVQILEDYYGVPTKLQNDANACALAEWKFGAGIGFQNLIFLTFGTGLGAGLIFNGQLYTGASGMAGEAGHIRLDNYGPSGYGKRGSFEGFCSGRGLEQIGYTLALEACQKGTHPSYFPKGTIASEITAKTLADAARLGDNTACEVYRLCGEYLGRGLSILIDLLNPEAIIIGSIFTRSAKLMSNSMEEAIKNETLASSRNCCQILPAALKESLGDYAALTTALI